MNSINYIGCLYKESPTFDINRPLGSGDWLLIHFHTEIIICLESKETNCPPGTVILFSPGSHQHYHHSEKGFINDWVHFASDGMEEFAKKINLPLNTPLAVNDSNFVHGLFTDLEKEHLMKSEHHGIKTDLMINAMLIDIQRSTLLSPHKPHQVPHAAELRKLRSEVLSTLDQPWTVAAMSEKLTLSRSRFTHLYTCLFGVSPKADLLEARIQMAKHLLAVQNQGIGEVAEKVGFDSIYHFSKQFKLATGSSPSHYRHS